MTDPLEILWNQILSRDPEKVRKMFVSLPKAEKIGIRAHLIRMTTEEDWHPEQVKSASIALAAIKDIPDV